MKYIIIVSLLLIAVSVSFYIFHQNRKSNNNMRSVNTKQLEKDYEVATFAGGCFWCTESDFEKVQGVKEVVSGYTGGNTKSPTYKDVSNGGTGHREAVQVFYDDSMITYEELLDIFWTHVDPTDAYGQFIDRGFQYSPAIFYHNDSQKKIAEQSKEDMQNLGKLDGGIKTEISEATDFYIAEDYHQDYHVKNPKIYKHYRQKSGRDDYIKEIWNSAATDVLNRKVCMTNVCKNAQKPSVFVKPSSEELKKQLTDIQYYVTQKEGTEKPFENEYWNNHEDGIYVDIVSGEPLFASVDKFDSGTGWPSFLKPIKSRSVTKHNDYKLIAKRIEIRSKVADSHLGHIIMDGPESNDKVRYCMNSAALKFIPKNDLAGTQYEEFLELFEK